MFNLTLSTDSVRSVSLLGWLKTCPTVDLAKHGEPSGSWLLGEPFFLAGGRVRASTGDLAVHGALIACVCVCVCVCVCACVCVCVCVRSQTPFSSRHEMGPSLFHCDLSCHPYTYLKCGVSFA